MTAQIREATWDDLPAVMAIERASFPTDAWSERAMRDAFRTGDPFVAEEEGSVVGYAVALAPPGSGDADVLTIAVDSDRRGRGTGTALLGRLLDTARRARAGRVFLEVRADSPDAERLYARHGFQRIGIRPRYYQPDDVDAVVMRLDLADRP